MIKLAESTQLQNNEMLLHLVWAALEKVSKKELDSDALTEGSSHEVLLKITGTVDDEPVCETIASTVTVGYSRTKSSSVNPQIDKLLAWVLSKLNGSTRNRILLDIPAEFSETGEMPESDPVIVEQAKYLLKHLRQIKTVNARGPIGCQYSVGDQTDDRLEPLQLSTRRCD